MVRTITAILLSAALFPAALYAQVATTDLVPGASRFIHPSAFLFNSASYTPDNPAALAWGEPSRVGGGVIQGTFEDKINPANSYDFNGRFLGFRIVGEDFSIAAETQDVEDEQGGAIFQVDSKSAQIAFRVSEKISLGGGINSDSDGGTDADGITGGITVRFGEAIFVGAALLQVDLNLAGVSAEQEGTMLGAAYRTEGDVQWYLAYDIVDIDEAVIAGVGQGNGFEVDTLTLQVKWSDVLLGVALLDVKGTGITNDVSSRILDAGWAPAEGLTVSARITTLNETNAAGTTDDEVTTNSVNVAWMF